MKHRQSINDDPSGYERRYGLPGHGQARVSISSIKPSVIDDPTTAAVATMVPVLATGARSLPDARAILRVASSTSDSFFKLHCGGLGLDSSEQCLHRMRPLTTSWPPARRTAEASGAPTDSARRGTPRWSSADLTVEPAAWETRQQASQQARAHRSIRSWLGRLCSRAEAFRRA
jgi:hypothetical protein